VTVYSSKDRPVTTSRHPRRRSARYAFAHARTSPILSAGLQETRLMARETLRCKSPHRRALPRPREEWPRHAPARDASCFLERARVLPTRPHPAQSLTSPNCLKDLKIIGDYPKMPFKTGCSGKASGKPKGACNRTTRFRLLDEALSIMCSAPRSNINKNIPKCGLKAEIIIGIQPQRWGLVISNYFSSVQPISAFSRTDEQYFVDAVSMRPVILSKIPRPISKHCLGER
jgi:hypothetical protein